MTWDGTAFAGILALVASVITLVWTVISYFLTRHSLSEFEEKSLAQQKVASEREHHRLEMMDGIQLMLGRSKQSQAAGFTILERLKGAPWADDDLRLKVAAVLDAIVGA